MSRSVRCKIAVALLSSAALPVMQASAQEPQKSSALPIEVAASPAKTTVGGRVTLRGTTVLTGAKTTVTIVVQPPSAKPPVQLTAAPKQDGSFAATFAQTVQLGTYQVTATGPDGKTTAKTSFQVTGGGEIAAEVAAQADSLVSVSLRALDVVEKLIANLPVSPEREEAAAKLTTVRASVAQAPNANKALGKAIDQAFKAREKDPEPVPEWDQYVERLGEWDGQAKDAADELEKRIPAASAATQTCGQLDTAAEMLTMVSETMKLVVAPFDFSVGFWLGKVIPGLTNRGLPSGVSAGERFALVSGMKVAAGVLKGGPAGAVTAIPGLVADFGKFLAEQAFDQYCQKFVGPISGTYTAQVFTRKGVPWWDYTIGLDGKLLLMYEKNPPAGKPVGLIGYIEGNGQFQLRDNPGVLLELMPGTTLFHTVKSPPGSRYWGEIGQATRSLMPSSFKVPVKGVLAGDSIVLAVQAASHDFGDGIAGHSIWVVIPLGGMWPEVIDTPIQFQKAQPILERVIKRNPVMKVKRSSNGAIAEATFARDTTIPDRTIRVTTKLKVKACNPGCVPLPFTPGKKP